MKLYKAICLALCALLLSGCTAHIPAADYAPPEEERLVIYTSHKEEVYLPVIREFEERTGIWVDIVTGGTNELLDRIAGEQERPVADVMFGGGVESLEYYKECFTPYVSSQAEYIHSTFRSPSNSWTPFSALPVVLIYNTKLVRPNQLQSWADLSAPYFAGRIAFADPSISGSSYTALLTWLMVHGGDQRRGMEVLAQNLQSKQLSSSGDVLTAVSSGTSLVGITLEETAMQHIAAGADLALVYPQDGTSCVPDGSALVKNAPHQENAIKFLEFTLSTDVQQLLAGSFFRRSVRTDISGQDFLLPLSQIQLIDYDVELANLFRQGILEDWAALTKEAGQ